VAAGSGKKEPSAAGALWLLVVEAVVELVVLDVIVETVFQGLGG
jgi:hypothetical protein